MANVKLPEWDTCCGCGVCADACPKSAISMKEDDEGFAFPTVREDLCVGCGRCERVCPVRNVDAEAFRTPVRQYCVLAKDRELWDMSSSGGAFSLLCDALPEDAVIFGVSADAERKEAGFVHVRRDGVSALRKSKYIQAGTVGAYRDAERELRKGRTVLFSGTPCQIMALRRFLGREYENLTLVDVACHGVGSPGVFRRYLEETERRDGRKIVGFQFRTQRKRFGSLEDHGFRLETADGQSRTDYRDLFTAAFIHKIVLRRSCFSCPFQRRERCSDVTLADYKYPFETLPARGLGLENRSAVLIQTERGGTLFDRIAPERAEIIPVSWEAGTHKNPPLRDSKPDAASNGHALERRNAFFHEYAELPPGASILKALKRRVPRRSLALKIWLMIPERWRAAIKRLKAGMAP